MVRTTRSRRLVVLAYVVLTAAAVLAYHADADNLQWPFLVWIAASIIGTWVVDRGWFALMPLLAIPLAAPLGYPESEYEPLPTGYAVAIVALVAFGSSMLVVFLRARSRE